MFVNNYQINNKTVFKGNEVHKGWGQDITGITEYEKLPENAKKYLARLEELLEVPISIVSVGPDREQTIFKK